MFDAISFHRPKILLVDGDQIFGHAMERCAKREYVRLDCFAAVPERGVVARYDAVIFACEPENMPEVDMSTYLEKAFPEVPTLVVSSMNRKLSPDEAKRWRVRSFMHKDHDHESILSIALGMIPFQER